MSKYGSGSIKTAPDLVVHKKETIVAQNLTTDQPITDTPWEVCHLYFTTATIIISQHTVMSVCLPADVVDAVWMKRTKPNHDNKSGEHQRATVCEARSQQQTQREDNERQNNKHVPETFDRSQLLNETVACGLVCIVRQHWHDISVPTAKHHCFYYYYCYCCYSRSIWVSGFTLASACSTCSGRKQMLTLVESWEAHTPQISRIC